MNKKNNTVYLYGKKVKYFCKHGIDKNSKSNICFHKNCPFYKYEWLCCLIMHKLVLCL